jgi:hypothetical protein
MAMALLLANGKFTTKISVSSCGPAIQLSRGLDLGTDSHPQRGTVLEPCRRTSFPMGSDYTGDYYRLRSMHHDEYGR